MKPEENKVLTPEEFASYRPADHAPKLLGELGFGFESTFELAKQSGANIIGSVKNNQPAPDIHNGSR